MDSCRLCLNKEKEYINICSDKTVRLKLKECISCDVAENDSIPSDVCLNCVKKLNDLYEFKQMCIKSYELHVKSIKIENTECFLDLHNVKEEDFLNYDSDEDLKDPFNEKSSGIIESLYICEICSKEFDTCFEYLDHQEMHDGDPVFKCNDCSEVFSKRLDLVKHDNLHKIPCSICDTRVLKSSMRQHLTKHTERFKCLTCSKMFSSQSNLDQHIVCVHTKIRNHVCDICGKQFACKIALRIHVRIHSDQRLYGCKVCSYKARTSSSLYIHMSKHANECHICEVCSKTFKSNRNLKDHLKRVHYKEKKHQCNYCDKKFLEYYMLKIHLRIHTGVKPYDCNMCEKAFNRLDSLKEHMVIHGERTFHGCSKCCKKFTSKRGLTRHQCIIE